MLRRFADARLRARLAAALRQRNDAAETARTEKRRRLAAENEVTTLRVLLATWQRIARQAQDDLATARQETHQ
ncbi:hypothetical protein [Micromonospora chersina]